MHYIHYHSVVIYIMVYSYHNTNIYNAQYLFTYRQPGADDQSVVDSIMKYNDTQYHRGCVLREMPQSNL